MFLYVEVLAMVWIYSDSKQIPIALPVFIAITALARMTILQKEQDPIHVIYEASAILLLAIAAFIVNARPSNLALRITKQGEKLVPDTERSCRLDLDLRGRWNVVARALFMLQGLLALRGLSLVEASRSNGDLRLAGAVRDLLNAVLVPAVIFARDGLLAGAAPDHR
jgi:hypothetical protein